MISESVHEIQFVARQLWKRPGFTLTAVLVLTLGLGANVAIFSIVNAFLIRPLPYPDPTRLVALFERDPVGPPGSDPYNSVAAGHFQDWQKLSTSFTSIGAAGSDAVNLASPDNFFEPQRVDACLCSQSVLGTLGVDPMLGRNFRPDEDRTGAPRVAVISYGLWQKRFGGNPAVIHQPIRLNGENTEIVGVMPRGFGFPYRTVDVWVPLLANITPDLARSHDNHFLLVIGRLRPGVSVSQARAEIDGFVSRYKRAHPEEISGKGGNVVPLREYLVHDVRTSLLVLLGAVGCVLLIACVNVANLLLTRAAGRKREIAIREAIGASRGRIVRQLLAESVLLSLAGAACGLFLASAIIDVLVSRAPDADAVLPAGSVPLSPLVFLFAFGVALASGLIAGLFPAWQSSRIDVASSLKDSTRSTTPSRAHTRFRNLLVTAEVALSLVLLIAAALLARSFATLYEVRPGVRVDHTLMVGLSVPDPDRKGNAKISATIRRLSERMQHVPGVVTAGIISCPPVLGQCEDHTFNIEGHPLPPGQMPDAYTRSVDPGFLAAAGVPLLRGRNFTANDGIGFNPDHPKPGTILINDSLARQYFAGEDPLGRFITIDGDVEKAKRTGQPVPRYQVIGVVGGVLAHLDQTIQPTLYLPALDGRYNNLYLILHTAGEPHSVTGAVRAEIRRLYPELPLFDMRTMEEALGRSASDRQFHLLLFVTFALLAVLLAAVGVYGVLSYGVSQRRGEIGVRLALGATQSDVRSLILKQGMLPAAIGVAVGMVFALLLTRVMQSLLFRIDPFDPATFLLVPVFLVAVCACACYLPALRATRIDPTVALRTE